MMQRPFQAGLAGLLFMALSGSSVGAPQPGAGQPDAAAAGAVPARQTIVVYGASGKIGGLIVQEALGRGHRVVGVSRNPDKLSVEHEAFSAAQGDVTDVDSFRQVTAGADAVIISVQGNGADNAPENTTHARSAATAATALQGLEGAPYVLQIGGGSTIYETKEAMLENLPFPAKEGTPVYAMLFGHLVALQTYRASDIDWTVLTPPFRLKGWTRKGITDRTRTGAYRISTTERVRDADGKNEIFVADLAVAAVDEIENRSYQRRRFTVGY